MKIILKTSAIVSVFVLTGCASTGQDLRANTYNASELNQNQEVAPVNIISIMPSKINIDNSKQKRQAQTGGGMFGAIAGGVAGSFIGNSRGTLIGGAAGAAIGAASGSLVNDKVIVNGVTLAYKINDSLKSSTQVGFLCEYTTGKAIMVKTTENNTRIQPNSSCPPKS